MYIEITGYLLQAYIYHIINIKYDPLNIQICYRLYKYFYDFCEMYICTKYLLITIRIFRFLSNLIDMIVIVLQQG